MSKRPPSPYDKSNEPNTKKISLETSKFYHGNYAQLLQIAGNCWTGLLRCQTCKQIPNTFGLTTENDCILQMHCATCDKYFGVCTICPTNKKQFFASEDVKKYTRLNSHRRRIEKIQTETRYKTEESSIIVDNETSSLGTNANSDTELEQQCKEYFGDHSMYFRMQTKSLGTSYLFASSYFPEINSCYSNVSEYDSDFNLLLADFLYDLPKALQSNFAILMGKIKEYMLPQSSQESPPYSLKIPCSVASIRSTYLDGSSSMLSKLPLPNVSMPESNISSYSYSSLYDCTANFFAFGHGVKEVIAADSTNHFDGSTFISHLSDTRIAHEKKKLFLEVDKNKEEKFQRFLTFFTTFSGAFDPTVSLVKANRHGVWVLQVAFMKDEGSDEFLNTYVISLCAKSDSHEEVIKLLDDEIQRFNHGKCPPLYHGGLNKFVLPVIVPILHHADQPEKRELYGTKLGKGPL